MVYKYVYCRFTYIYHKKLTNNVGRSTYHTLILDEHYLEHVSHIAAFFEVSTTSQGTNRSTRKSQFLPESWGEWSNPRSGEWGGLMSFFLQEKDDSFKWIKQKCELYMFQLWKQKKKTCSIKLANLFFNRLSKFEQVNLRQISEAVEIWWPLHLHFESNFDLFLVINACWPRFFLFVQFSECISRLG